MAVAFPWSAKAVWRPLRGETDGDRMEMLSHESSLRLTCFGAVLLVMALWELVAPRRRLVVGRALRWFSNLGLAALNTLVVHLVLPLGAVGVSLMVEERHWGLLNTSAVPGWLAVAV